MQILLASAKIMQTKVPAFPLELRLPRFQKEAEALVKDLQQYNEQELAGMLKCNRDIARQNQLRYLQFFDEGAKQAAILAYNGQAYKHLKASTLTKEEIAYADQHLWITSFLYGLLRPLNGIRPYRLEGHIDLPCTGTSNIFGYWKDKLTDVLIDSVKADDGILVHLATEEFQHLFDWKRVCEELTVVQPMFYVNTKDGLKIQVVWAKTCRGAMTRFIIQNKIAQIADLQQFEYEGFQYNCELGETLFPHFTK